MADYVRTCPLCPEEFVGWAEHIAVNMLDFHIEIYHQDWIKRGPGHFAKIEEPKMFQYTAYCPFCEIDITSQYSMEDAKNSVGDHIVEGHADKFGPKITTKWQDVRIIIANVLLVLMGITFILMYVFNANLRALISMGVAWIVVGQGYAEIRANER